MRDKHEQLDVRRKPLADPGRIAALPARRSLLGSSLKEVFPVQHELPPAKGRERFDGDREAVRRQTVRLALEELIGILTDE